MNELRECPFCGGSNIDAAGWVSDLSSGPACDDCNGSVGSVNNTPAENVAAWNRRASDRYEVTNQGRAMLKEGE